ncbi:(Fe-S)-binding protein [[Eubacterium] cellulosolvens]
MTRAKRNTNDIVQIWLGCTSRSFLKQSVQNLFEIFKKLDINYKIIDDIDVCCGSVLFVTGQNIVAMENLREVEKVLNKKKVRNLVSLCPGCTRTFKEFYLPRKSNNLKSVEHYTQTVLAHLDGVNLKEAGEFNVTYHDPCHLARHMGIIEEPREIIRALPKVTFHELPTNTDDAFCCGSGGGMRSYNKDLANRASLLRLQEAAASGAEVLLTSCPFCERSFRTASELEGAPKDLVIINLVDFLPRFL